MESIFELIFEILGELILQFIFEALSEAGIHLFHRKRKKEPPSPWLAVFGYAILGCICGGVSLWLLPHFLIKSHLGRIVSLVVTPMLAAGAISLLGMWRTQRGENLVRLDKFTYAYVFACAMAAVRFSFASAG